MCPTKSTHAYVDMACGKQLLAIRGLSWIVKNSRHYVHGTFVYFICSSKGKWTGDKCIFFIYFAINFSIFFLFWS